MKRSVRQRKVLSAMYAQYKAQGIEKKTEVLSAVLENIDTNLAPDQFVRLFATYADYKMTKLSKMKGFPYYKTGYLLKTNKEAGGVAEVIVPCDLSKNVTKLHKSFYAQKKYKLSKTVKRYSKKITKKTKLTYKTRTKAIDNKY